MKKFTIEFVRSVFEEEGYELLSNEYTNHTKPLKFKCPNGHIHQISFANWKVGSRCRFCFFEAAKVQRSKIIKFITDEGYEFIDALPEGYNNKTKFMIKCPKGHEYMTFWNKWQRNHRCKSCGYEYLSNLYKHDYIFIKESIEKEGYRLLSKVYKNAFVKLLIVCPYGHRYKAKWNDWQTGYRCRRCADIKNSIKSTGPGNWNWKGGISCEPYCQDWTKEYKEYIKERDGHRCLNPYCSSKKPNDLAVHHIDYNKKSCGLENLITICRGCNVRANKDRKWHKAWYQAIMHRRYNYIY